MKFDISKADIISLLRIPIAFILTFTLLKGYFSLSLVIFIFGAISDFLDGYLSKLYGKSKYGVFIDPVSDRVFIGLSLIGLYFSPLDRNISIFIPLLIIGQDILLSPLGFYISLLSLKRNIKVKISYLGKVTTLLQYMFVILVLSVNIFRVDLSFTPFEVLVILSSIASGVHHLYIWLYTLRRTVYQAP